MAREGAAEGLWLRAERQIAGRGRQGRNWSSPLGNLYASTLVRVREGDPAAPTLALVAGVALHEVAMHLISPPGFPRGAGGGPYSDKGSPGSGPGSRPPRNPLQENREGRLILKWPNDLLVGQAKLAGILLERSGNAVVIGFGVNLAYHPKGLERPATSLAALAGTAPAPEAFVEMLAEAFARWLARWRREGLAPVRRAWLTGAHPLGTALATAAGDGLFDGLDEDGGLRLRLADGRVQIIHAGDVFLL